LVAHDGVVSETLGFLVEQPHAYRQHLPGGRPVSAPPEPPQTVSPEHWRA